MSHKSGKIKTLIRELMTGKIIPEHLDPRYVAFFECFNHQNYYEAHDVLEDLWLEAKDGNFAFYKGLIQLAGAFFHLKNGHLNPAARLLRRAKYHWEQYPEKHESLNLAELRIRVEAWAQLLEGSDYQTSPYHPHSPPVLSLET